MTLPFDTPNVRLESAGDIVTLVAETISQVRRGQIDSRVANAIGYLSGIALKAREQGELEGRIVCLEKTASNQGGPRVTQLATTSREIRVSNVNVRRSN